MEQKAQAWIGLGSNIEPRIEYLRSAVLALSNIGDVAKISSVYETTPVGGVPQAEYLNAVLLLSTSLGPIELAREIKSIEHSLGRKERPRWHQREIDLDILFYDDLILESPDLTIPHKEAHRRAFVLVPLDELVPPFIHPVLKKSIAELLKETGAAGVLKTDLSIVL